jgi:hypothetical protein
MGVPPVTPSADFLALEAELADLFGQSAVLVVNTARTYATTGAVTATTARHTVQLEGPVDETSRYAQSGTDERVAATFYLPAQGLTVTPKKGDHIETGTRYWLVLAVQSYQVGDTVTSYRLDCGETNNPALNDGDEA